LEGGVPDAWPNAFYRMLATGPAESDLGARHPMARPPFSKKSLKKMY